MPGLKTSLFIPNNSNLSKDEPQAYKTAQLRNGNLLPFTTHSVVEVFRGGGGRSRRSRATRSCAQPSCQAVAVELELGSPNGVGLAEKALSSCEGASKPRRPSQSCQAEARCAR